MAIYLHSFQELAPGNLHEDSSNPACHHRGGTYNSHNADDIECHPILSSKFPPSAVYQFEAANSKYGPSRPDAKIHLEKEVSEMHYLILSEGTRIDLNIIIKTTSLAGF